MRGEKEPCDESPTACRADPLQYRILGVWSDGKARAYPLSAFDKGNTSLEQELGGKKFALAYDHDNRSLRVAEADEGLQWLHPFCFAWYAFRPHTEVFARTN